MTLWLLLSLVAAVAFGVVGFLQKISASRLDAAALVVWVVLGTALTLPACIAFWRAGPEAFTPMTVGLGVFSGLLNGVGAWFLFRSLEMGGKASIVIPLTALYPLLTVALSVLFLNERLTTHQWAGVLLAVAGAALLSVEHEKAR